MSFKSNEYKQNKETQVLLKLSSLSWSIPSTLTSPLAFPLPGCKRKYISWINWGLFMLQILTEQEQSMEFCHLDSQPHSWAFSPLCFIGQSFFDPEMKVSWNVSSSAWDKLPLHYCSVWMIIRQWLHKITISGLLETMGFFGLLHGNNNNEMLCPSITRLASLRWFIRVRR
jgi:hypothetical protein